MCALVCMPACMRVCRCVACLCMCCIVWCGVRLSCVFVFVWCSVGCRAVGLEAVGVCVYSAGFTVACGCVRVCKGGRGSVSEHQGDGCACASHVVNTLSRVCCIFGFDWIICLLITCGWPVMDLHVGLVGWALIIKFGRVLPRSPVSRCQNGKACRLCGSHSRRRGGLRRLATASGTLNRCQHPEICARCRRSPVPHTYIKQVTDKCCLFMLCLQDCELVFVPVHVTVCVLIVARPHGCQRCAIDICVFGVDCECVHSSTRVCIV